MVNTGKIDEGEETKAHSDPADKVDVTDMLTVVIIIYPDILASSGK